MTIVGYYIGMLLGFVVVLFCNFMARWSSGVKRSSICDRCENLCSKDWKGKYWCKADEPHYFAPKYCSQYKER